MSLLYKHRHTILFALVIALVSYLLYRLHKVETKYEKLKKRKHRKHADKEETDESSQDDDGDEHSDPGSDVEAEIEPADEEEPPLLEKLSDPVEGSDPEEEEIHEDAHEERCEYSSPGHKEELADGSADEFIVVPDPQ